MCFFSIYICRDLDVDFDVDTDGSDYNKQKMKVLRNLIQFPNQYNFKSPTDLDKLSNTILEHNVFTMTVKFYIPLSYKLPHHSFKKRLPQI